jgi:hypothetical protein
MQYSEGRAKVAAHDGWEASLWAYICSSDDMHCPLYRICGFRRSGGWCVDDNRESVKRLLDPQAGTEPDSDFVKPAWQCGILQLLELLAWDWISKVGVYGPPVPSQLIRLADYSKVVVVNTVPLKATHGAVWCLADSWLIQLNANDDFATKRFTLFHEAFHIRSSVVGWAARPKGVPLFNELLAEIFAACTLTPLIWLEEIWSITRDFSKVAKLFNVSESVVHFRLRHLGLVD